MVKSYLVGRLYSNSFRVAMDYLVTTGEANYNETKGFLQCVFHVNASEEVIGRIDRMISEFPQ